MIAMLDAESNFLFENLLVRTHVIESLNETLQQMVQRSYMTKTTAHMILEEATKQYHNFIAEYSQALPSVNFIGRLQHYSKLNGIWTFCVDNSVIIVGSDPGRNVGLDVLDLTTRGNQLKLPYLFPSHISLLDKEDSAIYSPNCVTLKAIEY
ncbi:hypothetical protein BBOV_III008782 [Babesia bovis T2Bo]|uniref:hypothetical protein n=1 Tax=Babesia bovis T2Bo TaxID=484906 RepID=UPI001C35BB6B|nr:hypothetical protein BBOV_III008782 [Babesia bovis T2Bo]KAG6440002.1 hypothetical protein BBOV_III008782 [Babesia bovis T2Bo]